MPGKRYAHLRKLYFITEDRILVHLLDYIGREGELSQPDDITQFGIAGAIGLGRSTVSKAIRRLEGQGFITAQRAHVPAGKLRRTVYLLTVAGTSKAKHRRLEIEEDAIAFRDAQGVDRRLRVGEVPRLLPEYASLLDVMAHVARAVFDAATYEPPRRQRFVDLTDAVLRNDRGETLAARPWSAPKGGHHRQGTLAFQGDTGPFLANTQWIELVIQDVGDLSERVLRWELGT